MPKKWNTHRRRIKKTFSRVSIRLLASTVLLGFVGVLLGALWNLHKFSVERDEEAIRAGTTAELKLMLKLVADNYPALSQSDFNLGQGERPLSLVSLPEDRAVYRSWVPILTDGVAVLKPVVAKAPVECALTFGIPATSPVTMPNASPIFDTCVSRTSSDPRLVLLTITINAREIPRITRYEQVAQGIASQRQFSRETTSLKKATKLRFLLGHPLMAKPTELEFFFQAPPFAYRVSESNSCSEYFLLTAFQDKKYQKPFAARGQAVWKSDFACSNSSPSVASESKNTGNLNLMLQASLTDVLVEPLAKEKIDKFAAEIQSFAPELSYESPVDSSEAPTILLDTALTRNGVGRQSFNTIFADAVISKNPTRILVQSPSESCLIEVWTSQYGQRPQKNKCAADVTVTSPFHSGKEQVKYSLGATSEHPQLVGEMVSPPSSSALQVSTRNWVWAIAVYTISLLIAVWFFLRRIDSVTETAISIAKSVRKSSSQVQLGKLQIASQLSSDEVGRLTRSFNLVVRAWRNATQKAERLMQRERTQIAFEAKRNLTQKQIVDAIEHEISTPLLSLESKTLKDPHMKEQIERMQDAIKLFRNASTVESAMADLILEGETRDLAEYLSKFTSHTSEIGIEKVKYLGPDRGVYLTFDGFGLENTLEKLLSNADRHRTVGTEIEITLITSNQDLLELHVFNVGPNIPENMFKNIFDLRVTTSRKNRGLGLFMSRYYISAMEGALFVENRPRGVCFVIQFLWNGSRKPSA